MNIYFCRRSVDNWMGGLIISAYSEDRAKEIFRDKEDADPYSVENITPYNEGIVYNDEVR